MLNIRAIAEVTYTCRLSEEDEKKVYDYIKENPESFEFMSSENAIIQAVQELDSDCLIEIYTDSVESDFMTCKISYSEFNEESAEDKLNNNEIDIS